MYVLFPFRLYEAVWAHSAKLFASCSRAAVSQLAFGALAVQCVCVSLGEDAGHPGNPDFTYIDGIFRPPHPYPNSAGELFRQSPTTPLPLLLSPSSQLEPSETLTYV